MNIKISRVIAICGSNTLRSPTFERVLNLELSKIGMSHIQVVSAGANEGEYNQPADQQNAKYMQDRHSIQLNNHRSKHIGDLNLLDTDLIVILGGYVDEMVMKRAHPTLHYFHVRNGRGIDSPYHSIIPDFDGMKKEIDEAVQEVITLLKTQS